MRKILLLSTVLLWWVPGVAHAEPITAAISGWLTATFGATLGAAIGHIGTSLILTGIQMALAGKPKRPQTVREMQQPDSTPVYRFAYGYCQVPGTPAPIRTKGRVFYACYILNSRPSVGPFTVSFDRRDVEYSGDPYDFSGAGAVATNDPFADHVNYWIGRGGQSGPPAQILSEVPELFDATDKWTGRTVLWVRLNAGPNDSFNNRWPAFPPEVLVTGKWSAVWDMRDPTQDPDDPSTWKWSANHALCTLDAARMNPIRPYRSENLLLWMFESAADAADEPVSVKAGGTIPRYEINGFITFDEAKEVEDQLVPMATAGAGRLIRPNGQLGLLPGVPFNPAMTLTRAIGDTVEYSRWRPSNELLTEGSAFYVNPDRNWEDAETPTYVVFGAASADGGVPKRGRIDLPLVTDHRQAQRVVKILVQRTRMQRSIRAEFPPDAIQLLPGSWVTVNLPAPYHRRNGTYEVETFNPTSSPLGDDGAVAMRVGLSLRETSAAVYSWDYEAEEQDVVEETFDPDISVASPPTGLLVSTSTVSFTPVIEFSFVPSSSGNVLAYEWEISTNAGATWQTGGTLDPATLDSGRVRGSVVATVSGLTGIRVRAVGSTGASNWAGPEYVSVSNELIIDGGVF